MTDDKRPDMSGWIQEGERRFDKATNGGRVLWGDQRTAYIAGYGEGLHCRALELEAEVERLREASAASDDHNGKVIAKQRADLSEALTQWRAEVDRVDRLRTQLAEAREALEWCANEIARINIKIHGDLHGCDCEGGCSCKPELWCELEAVKYHCLGAALAKLEGGRDE